MIGTVLLNGSLWATPLDPHHLRCVSLTNSGGRCKNLLEAGQVLSWGEFQLGPHGYVHAYDGRHFADAERWLAQHCATHVARLRTGDWQAPEFRLFHVVRDAAHHKPYRQDAVYAGGD